MGGKSNEKSDDGHNCAQHCRRNGTSVCLRGVNLVVVGVDREPEPVSVILRRICEDGEITPMKLENSTAPEWFDAKKFEKGQRYFYRNFFAMLVSKLCGLILVLAVPSILRVLVMTGRSSTPAKAFRRYVDTVSNMIDWYCGDLTKGDSEIYRVLSTVRGKHCSAAKSAVAHSYSFISQKDLVLTQYGFMGLAVTRREFLGIRGNVEELEGFIHFWRTIGYFMGIEDRFNLCEGGIDHVTELCENLGEHIYKPLLQKPADDFLHMADVLLTGVRPLIPLNDNEGYMEFTRRLLKLPAQSSSRAYGRFLVACLTYVHTTILRIWWLAAILRPVLNGLMRFSVYGNVTFPVMAVLTMGKEVLQREPTTTVFERYHYQHVNMAMGH